jgi:adenylosuccinate synthase
MDSVVAVIKAYVTRVGKGPFPTEDTGPVGAHMRKIGAEFGSTTGRPRRCGWFDAVAAKRTTTISGATGLAITKLDVLSGLEEIQVCTSYELDGKTCDWANGDAFNRVKPVYQTVPGWNEDITHAHSFEELPKAAQNYVNFLSEIVGCPVSLVSVGPGRNQTLILSNPFG